MAAWDGFEPPTSLCPTARGVLTSELPDHLCMLLGLEAVVKQLFQVIRLFFRRAVIKLFKADS